MKKPFRYTIFIILLLAFIPTIGSSEKYKGGFTFNTAGTSGIFSSLLIFGKSSWDAISMDLCVETTAIILPSSLGMNLYFNNKNIFLGAGGLLSYTNLISAGMEGDTSLRKQLGDALLKPSFFNFYLRGGFIIREKFIPYAGVRMNPVTGTILPLFGAILIY